jgi:myo-inositol 2-dehydrogenase/D-chiro-inositol 1-dehydrogenase
MSKTIRLGLLGAGRIGRLHGRHLATRLPGATLAAIADIRVAAAQELAAELGVARVYDDPRRVIDDPSVDAVVICTSTDTHAPLIEAAAQAGKHIFCEKPIDLDLARIDHVLEAVAASGVKFQVGFNRRFDPSFARARDLVASGKIGEPHLVRITSRDPAPPPIDYVRVSGGLFLDMAIHDFDMARFLVGQDAQEIYATGAVLVDPAIGAAGDIDTALATLRFAGGALGSIDNSRRAVYGYDQRVEVLCSEGAVVVGNPAAHEAAVLGAEGTQAAPLLYFFVERYTEAYLREMEAFLMAVAEDTAPPVGGPDGREAVVMAYAAKRSLDEKRPVALREVDPARQG